MSVSLLEIIRGYGSSCGEDSQKFDCRGLAMVVNHFPKSSTNSTQTAAVRNFPLRRWKRGSVDDSVDTRLPEATCRAIPSS